MLQITVKDSLHHPVHLSQYQTIKNSTGEVVDFSKEDPYLDSINRANGVYTLLTDGKMFMTSVSGTAFTFRGWINGVEVISEPYLIGNDRCHVKMISGRGEVILN